MGLIGDHHLDVPNHSACSRPGVEDSGIAHNIKVCAAHGRSILRTQYSGSQIQHRRWHLDLQIDLICLLERRNLKIFEADLILVDAPRGSGNEFPAEMALPIEIRKRQTFRLVADRKGNIRQALLARCRCGRRACSHLFSFAAFPLFTRLATGFSGSGSGRKEKQNKNGAYPDSRAPAEAPAMKRLHAKPLTREDAWVNFLAAPGWARPTRRVPDFRA